MGKVVITVESIISNPNELLGRYGTIQQTISRTLFNFLINNKIDNDKKKATNRIY
jgi:hypothetical protein